MFAFGRNGADFSGASEELVVLATCSPEFRRLDGFLSRHLLLDLSSPSSTAVVLLHILPQKRLDLGSVLTRFLVQSFGSVVSVMG